ncbi:FmdE family protein [Candidatus Electronema sp. TJ]|uniref:FmdE family protein n=1 Tax=Candidatus Electronema sp. TJ TaxID=3401573 RepID=UPI003AA95D9E
MSAAQQSSDWEQCIAFHGHECPGLAIGYRIAKAAQQRLGVKFSADEDIVCVTENDACGLDAVQQLTGCTLGKGNLICRDRGKHAFSFFVRSQGRKLRVVMKKKFDRDKIDRELLKKEILSLPDEELFAFSEPDYSLPDRACVFKNVTCEQCGETCSERNIRLHEGKQFCMDCAPDYSRGW